MYPPVHGKVIEISPSRPDQMIKRCGLLIYSVTHAKTAGLKYIRITVFALDN